MKKVSPTQLVLIYSLFLFFACNSDDDLNPNDRCNDCRIAATIDYANIVLGSTEPMEKDTLLYHYNEDKQLVKRQYKSNFDSITYKNDLIDQILDVRGGFALQTKSFSYLGTRIESIELRAANEPQFAIDSFFYDSKGLVCQINTYTTGFDTSKPIQFAIIDKLKFVYDESGENLLRDTLFRYQSNGDDFERKFFTATEYSNYSTIRNPLYRSPFFEHKKIARNKYLNGRQDSGKFSFFPHDSITHSSTSIIDLSLTSVNECGYPIDGFLYDCN